MKWGSEVLIEAANSARMENNEEFGPLETASFDSINTCNGCKLLTMTHFKEFLDL